MSSCTSFLCDARYPTDGLHPIYLPPKFEYQWLPEKLINLDPNPGKPGYFAVLVRVADESNIAKSATLAKYVSRGQTLFQKLAITDSQMKVARAAAEESLAGTQQRIEQEWKDTLKCLSLPVEKDWEPALLRWRNRHAEITAYRGAANLTWVHKSQASQSALEE